MIGNPCCGAKNVFSELCTNKYKNEANAFNKILRTQVHGSARSLEKLRFSKNKLVAMASAEASGGKSGIPVTGTLSSAWQRSVKMLNIVESNSLGNTEKPLSPRSVVNMITKRNEANQAHRGFGGNAADVDCGGGSDFDSDGF
jgi:hypothetical protein